MNLDLEHLSALNWAEAIGRWHPLVLHLPVALFVVLFCLEFPVLLRRRVFQPDASRRMLVRLLVLSAPLAALSGWLLHEGGSYGPMVEWHEYLGIALCALALFVGYAFHRRPEHYPWAVCLGFLLMIPTAHLGGGLTHGEDFLFAPWRARAPSATGAAGDAGIALQLEPEVVATDSGSALTPAPGFESVGPSFEARCGGCHGIGRQRAGLSLATQEAALRGGKNGEVLVPGHPALSQLWLRMKLPLDHEDHMPPDSKPQPSVEEMAMIEAWILGLDAERWAASGAAYSKALELEPVSIASEPQPAAQSAEAGMQSVSKATPLAARQASAEALVGLRQRRVHVEQLAADQAGLWLDFEACDLAPGDLVGLLTPLAEQVVELSLAGKALGPLDLELLGKLPALQRLDLRRQRQVPLDLTPLLKSETLQVLNLAGTELAPGALPLLNKLPSLTRVHLWSSGLTELELAALSSVRPELQVFGAAAAPDAPIETD